MTKAKSKTRGNFRKGHHLKAARAVLELEARALSAAAKRLGPEMDRAVQMVLDGKGRLVVTGMGKSGLIGQKITATLASTGTPSFFLHTAEAIHGDLGMLTAEDVVLVLSNSGETEEVTRLLPILKRFGNKIIALTGKPKSSLGRYASVVLDTSVEREACSLNLAPTSSTTTQLAMGDALAVALLQAREFSPRDFFRFHPGGKLGKGLTPVAELMHGGKDLPMVGPDSTMDQAIVEISQKKVGMTCVGDGRKKLLGVITDGDLKRLLKNHGGDLLAMSASRCMHKKPRTIEKTALAQEALEQMERYRITSLVVATPKGTVQGVIHLHDLWGTEMF